MAIVVHSLFDGHGRQVVPAETLVEIWRTIVRENKVELLFYAGGINTPAEFLEFITAPRLAVSVASAAGKMCGQVVMTNDGVVATRVTPELVGAGTPRDAMNQCG